MKKNLFLALAAAIAVSACTSTTENTSETEETAETTPKLSVAWETDTTLITPESVIYDSQNDVYYVSCIGAVPPGAKDGDGYIAKIGANGEIISNQWVTGLNGPKGLALIDNILYVADIDQLVAINTENGEIISSETIEGATFLNDAGSTPNGDILITDSDLNTVFVKSGEETTVLFSSPDLGRLNGVLFEDGKYLLAGFNSGKLFSLDGSALTMLADSMQGADGIEKYHDGHFVSSWNGHIFYVDKNGKRTKLLDTEADKINAADIDVIQEKNLLLVPTFFANKVVAYKID